jgi:4-aminobutyrate aminotransferase
LVKDKTTKQRATKLRDDVIQRSFCNGLLLLPCGRNTIRLTPPLNISRPLVDEGLHIFEEALTAAEETHLNKERS